jgi:hypothetical protein
MREEEPVTLSRPRVPTSHVPPLDILTTSEAMPDVINTSLAGALPGRTRVVLGCSPTGIAADKIVSRNDEDKLSSRRFPEVCMGPESFRRKRRFMERQTAAATAEIRLTCNPQDECRIVSIRVCSLSILLVQVSLIENADRRGAALRRGEDAKGHRHTFQRTSNCSSVLS